MTRRLKFWLVVALLFTVGNLAGAIGAAVDGEWVHMAGHVALMLVGAYFVSRLTRGPQQQIAGARIDRQLDQLQQSVDAIALEVERIGEAQRFITKLAAEEVDTSSQKPRP